MHVHGETAEIGVRGTALAGPSPLTLLGMCKSETKPPLPNATCDGGCLARLVAVKIQGCNGENNPDPDKAPAAPAVKPPGLRSLPG